MLFKDKLIEAFTTFNNFIDFYKERMVFKILRAGLNIIIFVISGTLKN